MGRLTTGEGNDDEADYRSIGIERFDTAVFEPAKGIRSMGQPSLAGDQDAFQIKAQKNNFSTDH
jgi:hypothetical protein